MGGGIGGRLDVDSQKMVGGWRPELEGDGRNRPEPYSPIIDAESEILFSDAT